MGKQIRQHPTNRKASGYTAPLYDLDSASQIQRNIKPSLMVARSYHRGHSVYSFFMRAIYFILFNVVLEALSRILEILIIIDFLTSFRLDGAQHTKWCNINGIDAVERWKRRSLKFPCYFFPHFAGYISLEWGPFTNTLHFFERTKRAQRKQSTVTVTCILSWII